MPIPVQQFPVLTPGQMNPYNQAFSSGLEAYQNINKAAFQPYQLQADIASKTAYAANMQKQTAATILSNPVTVNYMRTYQPDLLADTIKRATGPGNKVGMPNMPGYQRQQGGQQSSSTDGSGLWGDIKSFMSGTDDTSPVKKIVDGAKAGKTDGSYVPPQQTNSSTAANSNQTGDPYMPGYGGYSHEPAWTNGMSEREIAGAPGSSVTKDIPSPPLPDFAPLGGGQQQQAPPTQAGGAPSGGQNPIGQNQSPGLNYFDAALLKTTPGTNQALNVDQQKALNTANANSQAELYKNEMKSDKDSVDASQKTIGELGLMGAYQAGLKPLEKGPYLGNLPGVTSSAMSFDKIAKSASTNAARALTTGHITNMDFQIGDKIKPTRDMTDNSFTDLKNYQTALAQRDQLRVHFDTYAFNHQWPFQNKTSNWEDYVQSHPVFDPKTNSIVNYNNAGIKTGETPLKSISANDDTVIMYDKNGTEWPVKKKRMTEAQGVGLFTKKPSNDKKSPPMKIELNSYKGTS